MSQDAPSLDVLTPRQLQVAQLFASGLSNKEIATKLVLSERSVRQYRGFAYKNLGIHTQARLIHLLFHHGQVKNLYDK
jgi:DNA-binding NarL/FixJ family response regulator